MNKIVNLLVLMFLLGSCAKPKDTITVNGIKFEFVEGDMNKGIAKCYHKNKNVKASVEVSNGLLNGKYEEFYESGKLKKSYNHKDGNIHGISKMYYKNGVLCEEGKYDNGYAVGTTLRYNYDGSKIAEIKYNNRKMVGLTEYIKGKKVDYKFNIEVSDNYMTSQTAYQFSVTPEPKMVKFFVLMNGRKYLIQDNIYTIHREPGERLKFVVKGVSLYGIPFMFSETK